MIKKWLSFTLVCLLSVAANSALVSAQTNTDRTASSLAKIKNDVSKRGTGEKSRVEVKMLDGTKLNGYISQMDENSFTLVDRKTKQPSSIAYRDVAKVSNRSTNGDRIALWIIGGAAAVAAIVGGSMLLRRCRNEGGC